MQPQAPGTDVFAYSEYRLFLDAAYRSRKARDGRFSHRFIARQVGASSAGWFADIVKGRTNLSGNHMVRLSRLLGLRGPEAAYFEALVRFDQAGSTEERMEHYRRLISIKGAKPELVGRDRFEFYRDWYHAAVRELLFFYDFKGDYAELGKRLFPPITAAEARKSMALLESLGFLKRGPGGTLRPAPGTLKKDPAFKALYLEGYLKANMDLGAASLERVPKEERDISTLTLSLSAQGFARAQDELRGLRSRLLALMEEDRAPERVYQCNLHLFPVTR